MNKKTKYTALAVLLIIVCSVLYGGALTAPSNNALTTGDTIKIGAALALTGDASTVSWGEASKNGAQLAVEDINAKGGVNGKKVELLIEDMQSNSKGSVSAVTKLVTVDKAQAVILSWLDVYQGAAPLAETYNVPIITPDGGIEAINGEKIYKNVFSTWYRTDVKARKIVDYMAAHGVKTLAGLYQNDSYYTDFSSRIEKYAAGKGIKIVATERVNEGTTDIRSQVLKIKSAKPDAIMFGLYDDGNIYNFLKMHAESFPGVQLYGDELVQDHYQLKKYEGLYDGTVYFHAAMPKTDFVERYKARFGVEPMFGAGTTYDAVMILAKMLSEGVSRGEYDSYLQTHSFDTVSYGQMTFDEIGGVKTANNQFDLWRVEGDRAVKVN